jgi:polyhydroxyalkanoate synthesis regulator phasin
MDAPADERNGGAAGDGRDPEQDLVTRAVGMLGLRMDDARSLFDEATARWRGDVLRIGEGSRARLKDVFRELGIVTRDDWDELELRVAQLEHRIRLLEDRDQP